ncbi:hypothetical protein B0H11DRAFT_1919358 [Mycena galericulata]|nr:hypothetical protein B0H11DRAFT_1919358 [Mycena galericulata]
MHPTLRYALGPPAAAIIGSDSDSQGTESLHSSCDADGIGPLGVGIGIGIGVNSSPAPGLRRPHTYNTSLSLSLANASALGGCGDSGAGTISRPASSELRARRYSDSTIRIPPHTIRDARWRSADGQRRMTPGPVPNYASCAAGRAPHRDVDNVRSRLGINISTNPVKVAPANAERSVGFVDASISLYTRQRLLEYPTVPSRLASLVATPVENDLGK